MKKKLIALVVLVLVLGGGAAFYFSSNKDNSSSSNSSGAASNNSNQLNATPTTGSYKATITTQADSGQTQTVMEHDPDKNVTKVTGTANGASYTYYYTNDAFYMCQSEDSCMKYASGSSFANAFDPSSYEYDQGQLDTYKNTSLYQGEKSCPAGKCGVWQVTTDAGEMTMYVDVKTRRVSEVDSTYGTTKSTIVYDFSPVSITLPTNATEVTLPQTQ